MRNIFKQEKNNASVNVSSYVNVNRLSNNPALEYKYRVISVLDWDVSLDEYSYNPTQAHLIEGLAIL